MFSFLTDAIFDFFIWLIVRDSTCPDCHGMLRKIRSSSVENLFKCRLCERLWVKRDGAYESHVSLPNSKEPHGNYLSQF
jgi:hypothetical protein